MLELRLPRLNPHMTGARIECIHARAGERLALGARLFDLSIDLTSAFSQDCPPISYFRIVCREAVGPARILVGIGDHCALDQVLAEFEPVQGAVAGQTLRPLRIATAGIVHHAQMWSGQIA